MKPQICYILLRCNLPISNVEKSISIFWSVEASLDCLVRYQVAFMANGV